MTGAGSSAAEPPLPRTRAATIIRWVLIALLALLAGPILLAIFFARMGGR